MNIRVLGLGNVLMSDDAFGPYVVRVLDGLYEMPENVQVVDAARPGLDLVPYLLGADVVILVDTVGACGRPGDIHSYRLDDLIADSPEPLLCPHDPGIRSALLKAAAQGGAPRQALLLGVVPEWEATGARLSHAVHELIEIGVISVGTQTLFDLSAVLPHRSDGGSLAGQFLAALFGYTSTPEVATFVVWLTYVVVVLTLFLRPVKRTPSAVPVTPEPAQG